MLANIVESTYQHSTLGSTNLNLPEQLADESRWAADLGIQSFYEHWGDTVPDVPSPAGTDDGDYGVVIERTGSVVPEETPYEEPTPEELKAAMVARPHQDFDASWQQHLEIMVLPITLHQYWDAFWADDAPYFVGAYDTRTEDEIVAHDNWHRLALSLETVHIHLEADLARTVARSVKGNGWSTHTSERDDIYLLEKNSARITLLVMTTFEGSPYADRCSIWTMWELMTPDPRSHQVVFRQTSTLKWGGQGKPWVVGRYLEQQASAQMAADVEGMADWFRQASENYLEGIFDGTNGPFENAIWPPATAPAPDGDTDLYNGPAPIHIF